MENKQIYNDYLMHHGVKGQKWGVRRKMYSSASEGFNNAGRLADKVQGTKARKNARKTAREMSDEELRKAINRMSMEMQYKNLSEQTRKEGKIQVRDILEGAGLVLGVAASGFAVAEGIQKLRKGD